MKYEINENTENKHTIESSNILCCGENGRVIAVFFNDYDLDDVINLEKENEQLKKALNVKNIIIENSMKSIELLKTQQQDK